MIVAFSVAPAGGESDSVSIRPGHTNQLRAKVDRVTQHLAD